jgi:CubicO group peptidase (beta-lactamase class C family)
MMRLVIGGFAVLIAVLSCTNVALTQVPATAIGTSFSKFVSAHDPGCAVLVIKDGQPVFRQGYGLTDLRTLQKIGPETNFRMASLTKQFTATAVMLLVHDGKLRYEDRLTDVIPDLPAYAKTITIRQLLNHTSGLADYETSWRRSMRVLPTTESRRSGMPACSTC